VRLLVITNLTLSVFLLFLGCGSNEQAGTFSRGLLDRAKEYVAEKGQPPNEYILTKFRQHDVIFLGETKMVKHDAQFVQQLIPRLHDNGINTLAIEYARAVDQPMIDSLLTGDLFDEHLARQILFNYHPHWLYQEYADIFRAAWQVNHNLEDSARHFHIYGINCAPDWSYLHSFEDYGNADVMDSVWQGCTEREWAQVIIDRVFRGEKVLVYCGLEHGFTEFAEPKLDKDGVFQHHVRSHTGQLVYGSLQKKAITISLHGAWPALPSDSVEYVRAAGGLVDTVMMLTGRAKLPIAFDVSNSPFMEQTITNTYYALGYKDFNVAMFCDGYIVLKPLFEFETVTLITDFLDASNIKQAQSQTPNPDYRNFSVAGYLENAQKTLDRQANLYLQL
jgi:hypothetical protein